MMYTHKAKRWHWQTKEGRRGLTSIVDCVDATIQKLKKYTKKSKERLITAASNSNVNIKTNSKTTKYRKQNGKKNYMDTSNDKLGGCVEIALKMTWT